MVQPAQWLIRGPAGGQKLRNVGYRIDELIRNLIHLPRVTMIEVRSDIDMFEIMSGLHRYVT